MVWPEFRIRMSRDGLNRMSFSEGCKGEPHVKEAG